MVTVQETAEKMKAEIIDDVKNGIVPANVSSFAELHDYVDANCYGGSEDLFGEIVTESSTDSEHQVKLDRLAAILNPAMDIVDAWIKAGGIESTLTLERLAAQAKPIKVTVYRPREETGLGPPQGFIGEDHPDTGDWVMSAKAELPAGNEPPRLLLLGRAFLIYSMYHAREPRFLGYAVENFGAACRILGYTLPLKDEAHWLTYGPEGLDPGKPKDYQHLFGHIAAVFGAAAAKDQAQALAIKWPARVDDRSNPRPAP